MAKKKKRKPWKPNKLKNTIHVASFDGDENDLRVTAGIAIIVGVLGNFAPNNQPGEKRIFSRRSECIGWKLHYPNFYLTVAVKPGDCLFPEGNMVEFMTHVTKGTITLTWSYHATDELKDHVLKSLKFKMDDERYPYRDHSKRVGTLPLVGKTTDTSESMNEVDAAIERVHKMAKARKSEKLRGTIHLVALESRGEDDLQIPYKIGMLLGILTKFCSNSKFNNEEYCFEGTPEEEKLLNSDAQCIGWNLHYSGFDITISIKVGDCLRPKVETAMDAISYITKTTLSLTWHDDADHSVQGEVLLSIKRANLSKPFPMRGSRY